MACISPVCRQASKILLAVLFVGTIALTSLPVGKIPFAQAEGDSPYRITEFPVRVGNTYKGEPRISGKWVLWRNDTADVDRITGRNLETGTDFVFFLSSGQYHGWPVNVDGDIAVASITDLKQHGSDFAIYGFRLPDGQSFTIQPFDSAFKRSEPRISGNIVVWAKGNPNNTDIYAYDISGQRSFPISTNPSRKQNPAISGNNIVWTDNRNAPSNTADNDIYGYDLSTGQEFRITANPEQITGSPEISGNNVVWSVLQNTSYLIIGFDIAQHREFTISTVSSADGLNGLDVSGDIVVWSLNGDIYGYDLKQSKQFIISRAIGRQTNPRISGKTVVWVDERNAGVGKYEGMTDIFGATLDPGPAPIPPVTGAPSAVDAKIEIVWPQGKPVTDADKANIGTWLFLPGTLNLAPCQFNPTITLWKAINNGPARQVGTGRLEGNYKYINGRAVPTWVFNDVDVSAARDPQNKIYFYTTIGDVPSQTNVWAHGVDARTYFPQQDIPTGVKDANGTVDAKIEIVWPQGNLPVDKAQKVNISASLFSPDTLQSVPQDFNSTVHLFRSLNNGIRQEVAVGQKRLVQQGSFTYPAWDFNDVDVSAANDPANKYYFTLSVDGVATNSNVWSHGADARTYFPQMDTPTQNCG